MKLKDFIKAHESEIDVLEVCDIDGAELDNVPMSATVIAYSKSAGEFIVVVDPVFPARIF